MIRGYRYESERPRKYWSDLKSKLKLEGNEVSEKIGQLKLKSSIIIKLIGSDSNGMDRRTTTSN